MRKSARKETPTEVVDIARARLRSLDAAAEAPLQSDDAIDVEHEAVAVLEDQHVASFGDAVILDADDDAADFELSSEDFVEHEPETTPDKHVSDGPAAEEKIEWVGFADEKGVEAFFAGDRSNNPSDIADLLAKKQPKLPANPPAPSPEAWDALTSAMQSNETPEPSRFAEHSDEEDTDDDDGDPERVAQDDSSSVGQDNGQDLAPTRPVSAPDILKGSAIAGLREKAKGDLSLMQMVERFAAALHEHQSCEAANDSRPRDAALAEALRALAMFTERHEETAGLVIGDGRASEAKALETRRELREALSKLQLLSGAA